MRSNSSAADDAARSDALARRALSQGPHWRAIGAVGLAGGDGAGPVSQASREAAETGSRPAAQVLIVEDELLTAWHVEMIVHDLGFSVCGIAARGEEAVKAAAELEPDIILMDV